MTDYLKISNAIISTAMSRGKEKTTCPSEIARALFPDDWRNHMATVRGVAIDLQNQGKVQITQHGKAINTDNIKGPVRIRIA
ncbi:hypothetical protein ABIC74_000805 [Mucilaginibacter rubeus]|uniref:DUF3253 domain-containing protein n=1 Tax=Mucilaginibacter rubeus TaxID=2027860 RepID=UPI0033938327